MKDLKLIYKLMVFPVVFVLFFIIILLISINLTNKSGKLMSESRNVYFPSIELSLKLEQNLKNIQRNLQDAVAAADEFKLEDTDTLSSNLMALCSELSKLGNNKADSISTQFTQYYKIARNVSLGMINGDISEELSAQMPLMLEKHNKIKQLIYEVETTSKQESQAHFNEIASNNKRTLSTIIFFAIISIILVSVISWRLSKAIIDPIDKALNYIKLIADKKLDFVINESRKDEIGELYDSIKKVKLSLTKIVSSLRETSNAIVNAGKQLSSMAMTVSQGANQQASTTEQISSSMEEMLAVIESNIQKAESTSTVSTKSATEIKNSSKYFIDTINSVNLINENTALISEIAEKTDMLAINAAIEAARAGEAGKGFSVVSHEIRKLADKTKSASTKIRELSQNGQQISKVARQKLEELIPEISQSAKDVLSIVEAGKEQSIGAKNINEAIIQLVDITNQNSSSSEEMSTSSEQLQAQAEQLKKLVEIFKMNNENKECSESYDYNQTQKETTQKEKFTDNDYEKFPDTNEGIDLKI